MHSLVSVRARQKELELFFLVANTVSAHRLLDDRLVEEIPAAARVGQKRRVRRKRVMRGLAEQTPRRNALRLATDVPERDVERAKRMHQGTAAARHSGPDVERLPD